MLRSFIALELPAETHNLISSQLAPLQKALPRNLIRWVVPRNIHLTLKFLGDVSPAGLEELSQALAPEILICKPFTISLKGLGAFPNPRRARVLWIGLEAPPDLKNLCRLVDSTCTRLGYEAETRPFSPHLTLGRVRQNVSLAELQQIHAALEAHPLGLLGSFLAEAVTLIKSDLQPGGSIYTALLTLPMKGSLNNS